MGTEHERAPELAVGQRSLEIEFACSSVWASAVRDQDPANVRAALGDRSSPSLLYHLP